MKNKILIVGDACRGKSELAQRLSKKLGIPSYSTDDFYYEVKFTKVRDKQESFDGISKIYKKDKWIVEGTTERLIRPGLDSADIIVNLKHKNIPIQWVLLFRRYLRRDNETIGGLLKLMKHVLFKKHKLGNRKGKLTPTEVVEPYKHKVITFHSFKEINNFVDSL